MNQCRAPWPHSGLFVALTLALLALASPASAALRWNTQVSSPVEEIGNSFTNGNTTRKVAVHPNGTIYVCYHGANGIHVASSQDGGQSFPSNVQVLAVNYEAEVAVAATGIVYLAWVDNTSGRNAFVSRSLDQGATFEAPVLAGAVNAFSTTVHMATDGQYVYLVDNKGKYVLHSADSGQSFSSASLVGNAIGLADVHVVPATHDVIVQADDPLVSYFTSSDHGATFSAQTWPNPVPSVSNSVSTLSTASGGLHVIVAGDTTDAASIDMADGTSVSLAAAIPPSSSAHNRSIASDIFGNVVTGFYTSAISSVQFSVSQDLGATFSAPVTVDTAIQSCAAINSTNGDMMFGYEKGGKIYLSVYNAVLLGYGLVVDSSNITFATQTISTSSAPKTVTITNPSATPISINSVTPSGDFSQTNDAPGSLGAGASFTVNVTFTPTATGTLNGQIDIDYGASQHRIISLSGEGTAAAGSGTPTSLASNVTFPGVSAGQLTVNWTNGNGTARAVFMAAASSGQAAPSDFMSYTASTTFGSGSTAGSGWYCVYNGVGSAVTVSGLAAATTYRVHVVEYNGGAGAQAYNTSTNGTNPANKATTAQATIPALDSVGTAVMAALLIAVAAYSLRRRRAWTAV